MSKPRRYVRVRLRWHKGRLQAAWGCVLCHWILCHLPSSQWFDPAYAHQRAGLHAAMCPAVAAAMERDQLRAELDRMRADRNRLRDRLNQINPLNKDNE